MNSQSGNASPTLVNNLKAENNSDDRYINFSNNLKREPDLQLLKSGPIQLMKTEENSAYKVFSAKPGA